ncbi:MAG: hypothetical protein PHY34_03380 [Patescibacteria group bacterium]|nr:hypothetical protein [Patescibacteria group bacterium]MDD5716083.1 hypothetical protein [Patescibacteria group bacterium]
MPIVLSLEKKGSAFVVAGMLVNTCCAVMTCTDHERASICDTECKPEAIIIDATEITTDTLWFLRQVRNTGRAVSVIARITPMQLPELQDKLLGWQLPAAIHESGLDASNDTTLRIVAVDASADAEIIKRILAQVIPGRVM